MMHYSRHESQKTIGLNLVRRPKATLRERVATKIVALRTTQ